MSRFVSPLWMPRVVGGLLLGLGGVVSCGSNACASVMPRLPDVQFSHGEDFRATDFVVYRVARMDPWATGLRIDPASGLIVPRGATVKAPFDGVFAVMAVPHELIESVQGKVDPAWAESPPAGAVRVPEVFETPMVFRNFVLDYRLEKSDAGPKLALRNEEAYVEARREPMDTSAELPMPKPSAAASSGLLWGLLAGGGIGLLVGGYVVGLLRKRGEAVSR